MRYLSIVLVDLLIKNSPSWWGKRGLLVYSFELLLDRITMFGCIIVFSILTNTVLDGMVVFISMTIFRNLFPGFHFKHFFTCIIFSLSLFYLAVGMVVFAPDILLMKLLYVLFVFDIGVLLFIKIKQNYVKVISFCILFLMISIAYLYYSLVPYLFLISLSLCYSLLMFLFNISMVKRSSEQK
ncbi:accessory gene regulator B family protein [Lactiplantibacillus brownii]|uniref:accessory gene regulator B family protein n=1 Tax=Lactiplantibacillus brownii TaxID=3069269 RepID=UPI003898F8D3